MIEPKYIDAFADWDAKCSDFNGFRVFLVPEQNPPEDEEADWEEMPGEFLRAEHGESLMARLYLAAFVANPKDFRGHTVDQREVGFDKSPKAKRAAKAVKEELARIAKGEPGPSDVAVQFAAAIARSR